MQDHLTPAAALPADGDSGTLIGRAWLPGDPPGPAVVAIRDDGVFDLGRAAPTVSELLNADDPVALARSEGERIGDLAEILANSAYDRRDPDLPWLLAPCDLQAIKACGVTFATSMLERVIEEQARGDASKADAIRRHDHRPDRHRPVQDRSRLGCRDAAEGAPDRAEAPGRSISRSASARTPRSSPSARRWRRSAPAARSASRAIPTGTTPSRNCVLAISARGQIVGATPRQRRQPARRRGPQRAAARQGQGQQRLLRDRPVHPPARRRASGSISCARPRSASSVRGEDGFALSGTNSMAEISRDITDLAAQTLGANHQYPDGVMLFTGTMFAPIQDRDHPGQGFTHKVGDLVRDRLSRARHAGQPGRTIATGSRPGRSARAH